MVAAEAVLLGIRCVRDRLASRAAGGETPQFSATTTVEIQMSEKPAYSYHIYIGAPVGKVWTGSSMAK